MKSKILLLVLLTIFIQPALFAQANCSPPPDCIINSGFNASGATSFGAVITNTMFAGWSVLTGTPITGYGMPSTYGFEMVSDAGPGEGMYTCYNFKQNRIYKVCFRARNTTSASSGALILEAHDGASLSQYISNPSSNFYQSGSSLADFSYTFTAQNDFTQLRIYTNATPNSGNPYAVVVDDVCVVEVPVLTTTLTDINGCQVAVITANSNNNLNLIWSPNTGLTIINNNTVQVRPCDTTTYTVSYTAQCAGMYGACTNNTEQITINVNPFTINNYSSPVCKGVIDLQYSGNACPGTTFKWTGPKGKTFTGPNLYMPSSIDKDLGIYTLKVTYPHGCIDSVKVSVSKNCCNELYPIANFEIDGCNPIRLVNTSTFNGQPALQGDWHWDFGNGATSTIRNPSQLYTQLGPQTICLTAVLTNDQATCCSKICMDVDVCDFNCGVKAAFDYKILDAASQLIQLIDKSAVSYQTCNWQWTITAPGVAPIVSFAPSPSLNLPIPPGMSAPYQYTVRLDVDLCWPNGQVMCHDHWDEIIIIP